jgi:hypothetical protein
MLLGSPSVRAELAYFASGRSLPVKGHHFEGDMLVLSLRGGGEIVCERTLVVRIEPDEVAVPDPNVRQPDGEVDQDTSEESGPALMPDPRFDPMVRKASARHGIDARLVHAVIVVESGYRQHARSRRGAVGLMQLLPATARRYGVFDLYNPVSNIEAGVRHLRALLGRFPLALALAAYNAGEAAVERYGGIPPYPETEAYVSRVLRLLAG